MLPQRARRCLFKAPERFGRGPMRLRSGKLRGLSAWLLALSQFTFLGCRSDAGRGGKSGGLAVAGSTAAPDMGLIVYNVYHQQLQTTGTAPQIAALEKNRQDFIDSVNRVLPN